MDRLTDSERILGHQRTIEDLTRRIRDEEATSELYVARAKEHLECGSIEQALSDLDASSKLGVQTPNYFDLCG